MNVRNLNITEMKNFLKNKKIIFAAWKVERKDDNPYQNWYLPLKDLFGKVIAFDTAKHYFHHGKKLMNKKLLDLINKEKPDYVFSLLIYDEIDPLTLQKIRIISPKTITLNMFTDDDWRYDDFSRFYSIFIDYPIVNITDVDMKKPYLKDGIKNLSLSFGMNCSLFRPLNIEKKYDVSFVGRPNASRVSLVKLLLENGININVWGDGWENYLEIRKAYRGHLPAVELVKVTNQSKINLGFTQGGYGKLQIKGRVLEIAACKSFCLLEYFSAYNKYFKEGKELVMFKNNKDLLNKIRYYLKHEKEREKIAEAAHKRMIKQYNKHLELIDYFSEIRRVESQLFNKNLPILKGTVSIISINDINKGDEYINKKIGSAEYVAFKTKNMIEEHPLKLYLQQYALEKTGKEISCCDYYISSGHLENYLLFKARAAFAALEKRDFNLCLNLSQIMIKKEYFLDNLEQFKAALNGEIFSLIEDKNTSFISIPLLSINKILGIEYQVFKKAFQLKFLDALYALYYQKKLLFNPYLYSLIFNSLFNNHFLLKAIKENLSDKKKLSKFKKGI